MNYLRDVVRRIAPLGEPAAAKFRRMNNQYLSRAVTPVTRPD
jgi:hypothetical protein